MTGSSSLDNLSDQMIFIQAEAERQWHEMVRYYPLPVSYVWLCKDQTSGSVREVNECLTESFLCVKI